MSVREGQPPATQILARPATTRANHRLSHAQMSQLVSTIVEMSAATGPALRRSQVRDSITDHLTRGRAPAEILLRARNAYGIVDPTGETAARNVDTARRLTGCSCGCAPSDPRCAADRPAPDSDGSCCGPYSLEQLAQGIGCVQHARRVVA